MDVPELLCSRTAGGGAKSRPYADVLVTLSKQEHIALVCAANYWKMEHRRAAERALSSETVYQERLRQAAERAQEREAVLLGELEAARAKIRDLEHNACLVARASATGRSMISIGAPQVGYGDEDISGERPAMVARGWSSCRCAARIASSNRRCVRLR